MPTDTNAADRVRRLKTASELSRRGALVALVVGGFLSRVAQAQVKPPPVPAEVRDSLGAAARLQGTARLRMFGLHIYDARLWTTADFDAQRFDRSPSALELIYARSLKGPAIAQRSLEEMRRGGPIADAVGQRWLDFMREAFPDVGANDRLCGVWQPQDKRTVFFVNGAPGKTLVDPEFGPRFFGIWLAEHSSQPDLRLSLLGQGRTS
jgi:hypothetical protein